MGIGMCVIILALSSGCTSSREYVKNGFKVGPNYRPPCAPADDQWIAADDPRVLAATPNRDTWWTVFGDPVLNDLLVVAYRQNPTLKVACWRIQRACAVRGVAVGEFFPQQQALLADYGRKALSQNVNEIDKSQFYDETTAGAGLVWELDFWGRYRRAIEAANAQLDASVEGYNNALVLLLADVAADYVET